VTEVASLKHPRGYRAVYVDGELALKAHHRALETVGIRTGVTLGSDDLRDALAAAREQDAYRIAVDMLARRDRTEAELARLLKSREFPQPTVATVLDRLRDKGLIDDRRYAEEYVRTQSERRGLGPAALRAKLVKLGIASDTIDEALAAWLPEDKQREIAEKVARSRLPRLRRSQGDDARPRLYAFVIRRGFDHDLAMQVLDDCLGDE